MMPRFVPTALFFIAIAVYFNPVVCLKCYVCNSLQGEGCSGEPSSSFVQECPKRPSASGQYCRKISQQLYFKNEKQVTTIRECAYEKNTRQCYKTNWVYAAYQETCECDDDMCNTSSRDFDSSIVATTLASALLAYLILR